MKRFSLLFSAAIACMLLSSFQTTEVKPMPKTAEESAVFYFDEAAFKESYDKLFEEAKARFKNIKTGDGTAAEDGNGNMYETSMLISQAASAKITVDSENYHRYVARYPEMAELNQAGMLFNQILTIAENKSKPDGYVMKEARSEIYVNNVQYEVQLNTKDFTELGRVPSFKIGIVKENFAYIVEITVSAPWF